MPGQSMSCLSDRPQRKRFCSAAPWLLGAAALLSASASAFAQRMHHAADDTDRRFGENAILVERAVIAGEEPSATFGPDGVNCPQQTSAYTNHQFTSGPFTAQAGFVGQEIAAVSFTIPASHFPIRIDRVDGLFGTQSLNVQTTTHWSMLVWAGEPNSGQLVYTIVSDGTNPPHMVVGPPNNAIYLQSFVDPNDPEQIIVPNNGSNKFSVGFRIDQMNNPPTTGCNFGCTPAPCCPHNQATNIFPTTDTNGLQYASENWIYIPPMCGPCVPGPGWLRFSQLGASTPSGDWNIRALYTPTSCPPPTGACCLPTGACLNDLTQAQCTAQGGTFQGANTSCATINCPVPMGACCLDNGTCSQQTSANCTSQGGTWFANTACSTDLCRGACCVPSTQQCVFTTSSNCAAANGTFHGMGTNCTTVACFGACCLPNGSCIGGVSPASCQQQNGVFQGANTTCQNVNCPPPTGACCVGTNCLSDVNEFDCTVAFGGTWLGMGTTCSPTNPCNPIGACCLGQNCLSDVTNSDCTLGFGGAWQGPNSTCAPVNPCTSAPCPADIAPQPNGDGVVNVNDLLMVINQWGQCPPPPASCPADIAPLPNGDGVVNVNDLLMIINQWGPCP